MRQLITLLLAAAAAVLITAPVHADNIEWTGDFDTSFFNPLNWSPMNVPGQFDTAIFNISFPLVTFGNFSFENDRLSVPPLGDGTLNLNGNYYELFGFTGPASIEVEGTVTISDGQLFSSNEALIHPSGSMTLSDLYWLHSGALEIQGSLSLSPVPGPISTSVTIDEFLNIRGSGTCEGPGSSLTISNFALVLANDYAVGTEAGASSLTLQSGGTLVRTGPTDPFTFTLLAQHPDSCVTVTVDDSEWMFLGRLVVGAGGSATLTILNHANVLCSGAQIASQPGSEGTVTVTGTDSQNTHTSWEITEELEVGNGSLLIEKGAEVDCGSASIGEEGGFPGTVTVTDLDSGWEIEGELAIGPGDLTISAGGFVLSSDGFIGGEGAGSVTLTGADSQWINTGLFIVGIESTGSLDIADGGTMISGPSFLGLFAGSSGTVTVDGPGSTWIDLSDLFVGDFGSGTLNITNGGSVFNTAGFVGSFAGSNGTALVDGPGSTWTNLVSLAVGNFGAGSLTVSNGGTVATLQVTVTGAGEVHGDGMLAGNVTNSSGLISPGLPIGTLNIQGDYLQNPSAVLDIKLSASGGGRLAITGQAELVYPTLMLSVVSGDEPRVGQMFTILTAAHIMGQDFTVIDDGGQYNVTKSSTDIVVTVVALPCPADLDGSGDVGVSDFLVLLGVWGPCPPKGDCPADFDGSDDVGVSDFLELLGNWGPCP